MTEPVYPPKIKNFTSFICLQPLPVAMATDIKRDACGGYVQRTLDSHRIFRQRDNYSMESHDHIRYCIKPGEKTVSRKDQRGSGNDQSLTGVAPANRCGCSGGVRSRLNRDQGNGTSAATTSVSFCHERNNKTVHLLIEKTPTSKKNEQ